MPTIEENLAHLSFLEKAEAFANPLVCASHLRAALDREAAALAERDAALVQIGELAEQVGLAQNDVIQARAERDAARAEVSAVIDRMEVEVRLLLAEYFRRGVSKEKWQDAAGVAARRVRAALEQEKRT